MSLLRNQAAADAIAAMLADPLQHPGNPDTKQPSASLVIPMFRLHGKPAPFADAGRQVNATVAEAIVYFIEHNLGLELIPTAELDQLRGATA